MTLSIHRRAIHYGSRTAVVDRDDDATTTYANLASLAREYGTRLAERGINEGDPICVVSRNRLELLGLFFAAVDRGAILAPISHRLPATTVETLRERIDPAVTLCEERFVDLAEEDAETFETFADGATSEDDGASPEGDAESVPPDPDRPLMYLHTGGTTGVPKVVVVSSRQVEWNCITEVAAWGLGKQDVSPALLPFFHTGGWNLLTLPTLYVGGRVVLLREFDPDAALRAIEAEGATHVFAVAAIFQAMAGAERFERTDCSSVDWFMSGGGPTPEAVIESYRDRGYRFTQGYGLTEGGPNNLYLDPDRPDAEAKATECVGRPFPDCEARLVDDDGSVIGPEADRDVGEASAVGELELRGPVSADRHLATEDGTFEGEWVSTGDLARRDGVGDYVITGRTDNMFVSGGENVYPEEIEAAIEDHPAVDAAAVVGVPHERWGTVPKAVVVPESEEGGDRDEVGAGIDTSDATVLGPEDLESFLRDRLAGFQVPREYEFVDELPASGPGKLDRGELERRFGDGEEGGAS